MKYFIIFLCAIPSIAMSQFYINPEKTQQAGDIILQNTDVYYKPIAPPGPHDVREYLSSISDIVRDPNGVGTFYRDYPAVIWDTAVDSFILLQKWCPFPDSTKRYRDSLGQGQLWQRFFTARDKADGSHSDIIVGSNVAPPDTVYIPADSEMHIWHHDTGLVVISKNEDVDFRASRTVKMESGFHVMPGAFFHAYTEPRWGSTVFGDEFADSVLDRSKWYVRNGNVEGGCCSSDSNVSLITDADAHDGHALDIRLVQYYDTCSCATILPSWDDTGCMVRPDLLNPSPSRRLFSTAIIYACPWPWNQWDSGRVAAYANAPYGRYEIREKFPHVLHHMNNWGGGAVPGNFEWDNNESWSASEIHPAIGSGRLHGPYHGHFEIGIDTEFISSDIGPFRWSHPTVLVIDRMTYDVNLKGLADTLTAGDDTHLRGGFPSRLLALKAPITFYWMTDERNYPTKSDVVTWKVRQDAHGHWTIFSAPYRVLGVGDSLRFTKSYQPVQLTLKVKNLPDTFKTILCRWDSVLNCGAGDTGYLVLGDPAIQDTGLSVTDLHTNTEQFSYQFLDYGLHGWSYATPPVYIDTMPQYIESRVNDVAWAHTPYVYHTFSMEWLPNEIRFLVDSNVVERYPDRMIPPGYRFSNWAQYLPRIPVQLNVSEPHMLTNDDGSVQADEIAFFSTYGDSCSGCGPDLTVGANHYHVAHHHVDYAKIFNVPSDMKLPDFTH